MGQPKKENKNKKKIKGRGQKYETKEQYFTKNGGILLEKQIALSQGRDIGAGQLKFYSECDIRHATNNCEPDLVVGSSHGITFCRGSLDDRTVAFITPRNPEPNPKLADYILTDVSIAMVIQHESIVKIYGCCLETCVPIMVYEFYPNKDLNTYLHGDLALQQPMKWSTRLRAATDIAYALSYMHNALSKPVVHRDVRSFAILLDSSFRAKLGNLGYAVSVNPGRKDQRWPVHGTPGYIDPEYIETGEVTDKCDVYSFGVLMLELLTSREPVKMAKCGKDLVDESVSAVEINCFDNMIDRNVLQEGKTDEIQRFARLALKCVAKKGKQRSTMTNVVEELWLIQDLSMK